MEAGNGGRSESHTSRPLPDAPCPGANGNTPPLPLAWDGGRAASAEGELGVGHSGRAQPRGGGGWGDPRAPSLQSLLS